MPLYGLLSLRLPFPIPRLNAVWKALKQTLGVRLTGGNNLEESKPAVEILLFTRRSETGAGRHILGYLPICPTLYAKDVL
jgi:hypothetical protein